MRCKGRKNMDLEKIEMHTKNLKKYSSLLITQYKEIRLRLNNLVKVIAPKDSSLGQIISGLVLKYDEIIKMISDSYVTECDGIMNYINSSNQNLDELTDKITNSLNLFYDSQNIEE